MLYPKMNRARTVMDLSGLWEFKLGDYETPGDNCERLAGGERIAVPASYNDQKDDPAYKNHYGWAWYEREVTVPAFFKGQRLFLRFDAVTHRARIYINGTFVMEHKGGSVSYTHLIWKRLEWLPILMQSQSSCPADRSRESPLPERWLWSRNFYCLMSPPQLWIRRW